MQALITLHILFIPDHFSCLEQLYEYASMMEECVPVSMLNDYQELLQSVRHILSHLQEAAEAGRRENTMGRPALVIEEEQLSFFVDNGFKVEDMALIWAAANAHLKGD